MVVNRKRTLSFVVHIVENVDTDDTRSSLTAERRAGEVRQELKQLIRAMEQAVSFSVDISGVSIQVEH